LPPDAKSLIRLTRTPGIVVPDTVSTGPIYALLAALGYLWAVSGSQLWRRSAISGWVSLGNIGTVYSAQNIDIDNNADFVVVVNAPKCVLLSALY